MNINIIIDNKNSWFYEKIGRLKKGIKKVGHNSRVLSDASNIKDKSFISFFLSCEKYITSEIRRRSKYNIVVHASDLPKGKGMSPTSWQILEGENKIIVTLFEVADKIDAGDYYLKNFFLLDGTELLNEWQEKLYQCMEKMILYFISNEATLKPIKQKGKSSLYPRRRPEDSELNLSKSLKSQINLLRVVDNEKYPAFFKYKNKKYILKIFKG